MCGIYGVYNKRIDELLAKRCLDEIAHRGPDGEGLVMWDHVTFGHRRLAIMDVSDNGHQPMSDASGRYHIIFNGEVYNFLEIRRELTNKGYRFVSDSDTEVILYAYIEWGEGCLDRFNGMWAFAIYDREEDTVFLSRDRYGVKPLFYIEGQGPEGPYAAFASEMKALLPMMDHPEPNRRITLNPKCYTRYEISDECVFKGIKRLPAGSNMYIDKNGKRISRWYRTLDHLMKDVPADYEAQTALFRELFLDAVKMRMRSDVTIGTALSGGLDSSAVISAMAHIGNKGDLERVQKDWQHAYVASFPGTTVDETDWAKKVTDNLNIKATFVNMDPARYAGELDEMFYRFEELYLTSPIPMMVLYRSLREDNTLVTIDGHGADELFGGYTFDFIEAMSDAKSREEIEMIAKAYNGSFPHDGSNNSRKEMKPESLYRDYRIKKIKRRLKGDVYKSLETGSPEFESLDHLNKVLYASTHETILPTLLRNYDHYAMASGVEIRMPFMDHRIVELAFSIGFLSKLHGGYSKSIIRDAMKGIMPEEVRTRRTKIGFNTPIVEWMKGPLKEYFMAAVTEQDFLNSDLIDPGKVRTKVEQVITDPGATFAMGEEAFSAIYPYLWHRAFLRHR